MSARRHWSDFPLSLLDLVQKFDDAPGGRLLLRGVPKADAYSIRNEFHRFRRAITNAIHDNEQDPILRELYATVRDMSLQLGPVKNSDLYQIVYSRQAVSRYLDKWEASPPLVVTEDSQH
jgi:hypothetical protein